MDRRAGAVSGGESNIRSGPNSGGRSIASAREKIKWLRPHVKTAVAIAHFGCDIGAQTLALLWEFGPAEIIGLDINEKDILRASADLAEIRKEVIETDRNFRSFQSEIVEDDAKWWRGLDKSLFEVIVSTQHRIEFDVQDIRNNTGLDSSAFDLVYSDFVLNHLWDDKAKEDPSKQVKLAMLEMIRILRPSGIAAAFEPILIGENTRIDFSSLFRSVGFNELHVSDAQEDKMQSTEFVYQKPNSNGATE